MSQQPSAQKPHKKGVSKATATTTTTTTTTTQRTWALDVVEASKKRVVFVSLVSLSHFYEEIPSEMWDNSIVCANTSRDCVFHSLRGSKLRRKGKDKQQWRLQSQWLSYFSFEFLAAIMKKDRKGLVLWLDPCLPAADAWQTVSERLAAITVHKHATAKLSPLILDSTFWTEQFEDADEMASLGSLSALPRLEDLDECWISGSYDCTEEPMSLELDSCCKSLSPLSAVSFESEAMTPRPPPKGKAMFGAKGKDVLLQLATCLSLNYTMASEIFYQSNPQWLVPLHTMDTNVFEILA